MTVLLYCIQLQKKERVFSFDSPPHVGLPPSLPPRDSPVAGGLFLEHAGGLRGGRRHRCLAPEQQAQSARQALEMRLDAYAVMVQHVANQLAASPEIGASTCPEALLKREARSQDLQYDVKLSSNGEAFIYFSKSGNLLGQGFHKDNRISYRTQHQCKWFLSRLLFPIYIVHQNQVKANRLFLISCLKIY